MDPKKLNNLAELAKTDKAVFSSIYDLLYDKIYNFVRWNVNSNEIAQDIVSDIFLKAIKNIKHYNSDFYFTTWIFTIARNTLKDTFKKKAMDTYDADTEERTQDSKNSMEKDIETKVYINQLLQSLKAEEKEIISLKYFAELETDEISKLLNIPTKTVYTKITRALAKLSKASKQNNLTTPLLTKAILV